MADTFDRSCAHWSEEKRAGMDAFYALATEDYRHLARAVDWKEFFEVQQARVGARGLHLLDVACGSGKFPAALVRHAGVGDARIRPVRYALLDPSAFSLAEARTALTAPFEADRSYCTTLQDFTAEPGAFDIVWATHALYAVPQAALADAVSRFLRALAPGGTGFIAHAAAPAHYLRFYDLFLEAFRAGEGERYTSAEAIVAEFERQGASIDVRSIDYANTAPEGERAAVEGFLQRCAFDDSVSLAGMEAHPALGRYLSGCRSDGVWRFDQRVHLIFVRG